MSKTSAVVATTPFLTDAQAAEELRTTPLNVRRLAARGILKASYVGMDDLKILPADLAAYSEAGLPDFEMPEVSLEHQMFLVRGAYGPAAQLDGDLRRALQKIADETKTVPLDRTGNPVTEISVPIAGEIATIVNGSTYQSIVRFAGQETVVPFRTRAEGFAVNWLRRRAVEHMQSGRPAPTILADSFAGEGGPIQKLYHTQAAYQSAVNASWDAWEKQSVVARKTFPAPKPLAQPVTVTFRVPYSALGVDQQRVTQLAF